MWLTVFCRDLIAVATPATNEIVPDMQSTDCRQKVREFVEARDISRASVISILNVNLGAGFSYI